MRGRLYNIVVGAGLLVVTAAVYSNSLQCGWQFDDYRSIVDFDYARATMGSIWRFSPQRSFGFLTFWLNYSLCGYNVRGWHAVNILIHMANVLVVFGIGRRLFLGSCRSAASPRRDTYALVTAAFVAALFAVHPVQTQAVTYVVQRLELLGTLFAMTAFWCMCLAIEGRSLAARVDFGIAALAALALGALSKEIIVVAPVLVCAYLVLIRLRTARARAMAVAVSFGAFVILVVAALLAFKALLLSPRLEFTFAPFQTLWYNAPPAAQYYPTQLRVVLVFLRLCFLPYGQRVEYAVVPSESFLEWEVLLAGAAHVAVVAVAVAAWRRRPALTFGVAWFYAFLAPSSAVPNGMFEHRVYGALCGVLLAVAVPLGQELLDQGAQARRALSLAVVGMAAALVLCFGFMAFLRNEVWRSEVTLWRDAVEKSPDEWRANVNYGKALMATGMLAEAQVYLERSFALVSNVYLVPYNLGVLYFEMGEYSNSVEAFEYALSLKRERGFNDYVPAVSNALGTAYLGIGRIAEGTNVLACVNTAESLTTVGKFLAAQGAPSLAIEWYDRALDRTSGYPDAVEGKATAFEALGRTNEAKAVRQLTRLGSSSRPED